MKIIIEGNPREVAAFVLELKERQGEKYAECGMDAKTSTVSPFVPRDSNGINNEGISRECC